MHYLIRVQPAPVIAATIIATDGVQAILQAESGERCIVDVGLLPAGARHGDRIVRRPDGVLLIERPNADQAADAALLERLAAGAVASVAVTLGLSRERAAFELAAACQRMLRERAI